MINEVKKVLFIVNKFSGTGFTSSHEQLMRRVCKTHAAECHIWFTQGQGHATTLGREAIAMGFQQVVAVGGDGTANEVAQALLHSSATMAIIPKGSGNGLARHLGIPVRIDLALDCLFNSRVIVMDTFRLNGKLSLNVSGIGFDGFVAGLFGIDRQRGLRGYAKLVLNEFMRFPEFEVEIDTGTSRLQRKAFVIALANSSQYGNNVIVAPRASVCDQLLDITVLKKFPPYRLDFIYSFFSGTIDQSAYCEVLQIRNASISLSTPMPFHIDGEPAGEADQFKVEIIPSSLNMLAPRERKV